MAILVSVLLLCFIISFHEFGHFISAKISGVKVNEFSVGMGPAILQKQKGETMYSLRCIPLGGYCLMEGEDDPDDDYIPEPRRSLDDQSLFEKIMIMLCGPLFNVVLCFVMLVLLYFFLGSGLAGSLHIALRLTGDFLTIVYDSLKQMVSGNVSADDIVSVVGMVSIVNEQAEIYGMPQVIFMMAMISANLGLMNLLPLPALDGGRIIMEILKAACGGRFPKKLEEGLQTVSMVFLLMLMCFLMAKDVFNIFIN